jgi:uncharacterized protein (DUF1786 family)
MGDEMKILAIDIGTGTQDILLLDTRLDIENSFKMVLPSPTMIVHRRLEQATRQRLPVLLTGTIMGGGPSGWAAEAHARAGLPIFATPDAARSFNDDLAAVAQMGIQIVGEDETRHMPQDTLRIELRDFDFPPIQSTFAAFGVDLKDLDVVAVAVFDHGNAPPEISDRQFRFDYIDARIRAAHRLSAFAFPAAQIPPIMTRLQAVAASAAGLDCPLVVMDTAPAAVLGALFDPLAARQPRPLVANVGNFHTLAFRMGPLGIEGVFEHHTGLLDRPALERLLRRMANGQLTHAEVFASNGHGALLYSQEPLSLDSYGSLVVTGPRRAMLAGSDLNPHFAVPFGDMMISGCFGLVAAVANVLPETSEEINAALYGKSKAGTPPWEID